MVSAKLDHTQIQNNTSKRDTLQPKYSLENHFNHAYQYFKQGNHIALKVCF